MSRKMSIMLKKTVAWITIFVLIFTQVGTYQAEACYNSFSFTKIDASTDAGIAGATFILKKSGTVKYTATSQANGTVYFQDIVAGTYELSESVAPTGYNLTSETHTVKVASDLSITIDNKAPSTLTTIENTRKPNSFSFKKTDTSGTVALSGAVFGLYSGSTLKYSATSAADGTVTFNDIDAGTYTLKETTAPVGYEKSDETHTVVVAADTSIKVDGSSSSSFATYKYKDTKKTNGFSFTKTNASGTPVAGAVFGIYSGATLKYSATSAANGSVAFANIDPGTYTLKEKTAPTGYQLSTETHNIVVATDMSMTIDGSASSSFTGYNFIDARTQNSFSFLKTDAAGTTNLAGAVFGLYQGTTSVYSATSASTGVVNFSNIEPGTYTLKETTAPAGYDLTTETHTVVVAADMSIKVDGAASANFASTKIKNTKAPNGFTFHKTNADGTVGLSGAVFGLYSGMAESYTATSAADGTVSFANLSAGTYTLKEKTAPVGYKLSAETHTVVVAADGSITVDGSASSSFAAYKFINTTTFTEDKVTGACIFDVAQSFNLFVLENCNFTADSEGRVAVGGNMTANAFAVNFTNLVPDTKGALFVYGNTTLSNGVVTGNLVLNSDKTNNIAGTASATGSTIYKTSANFPIDFVAAAARLKSSSTFLTTLLTTGTISSQYTTAYTLTDTTSDIAVFNLNASTISEVIINAKSGATVIINVTGSASKSYTMSNGTHFINGTDKSNVIWNFPDATTLNVSSISVEGSILAPNAAFNGSNGNVEGTLAVKSFNNLGGFETHLPIFNDGESLCVNGFSFTKTNADGTVNLQGAVFGLYSGSTLKYSATSDANGKVSFKVINDGTYTLKEITAPAGYYVSSETHAVVVASDASITIDGAASSSFASYKFKNTPSTAGFYFYKVDDHDNALAGATFELYKGNTSYYSAVSDASGKVSFTNLSAGTYKLYETQAPEGYYRATEIHTVVVDSATLAVTIDGVSAEQFSTYKFVNSHIFNWFSFIKTNAAGDRTLAGAVFVLKNNNEEIKYTATSDENGVVYFSNIDPGNYLVIETVAPAGYQLSAERINVKVKDDLSVWIYSVYQPNDFTDYKYKDDQIPNSFTFTKTNAAGTVGLSGAVFGLYQGTTEVYSAISATDGTVSFANIEPGTYTLKETTAPVGYTLNTEEHSVVVASDMSITIDGAASANFASYKVKNTKIPNNFTFNKVDGNGNGLAGAVFGLYQGTTAVYSATSQSDGTVSFANIEPGTYTLKEITAPAGYELTTEEHTIVVADDMSVSINDNTRCVVTVLEIVNTRKPNGFTFNKTNTAGTTGLSGAVFGLYQGTTAVYSAISATDGTVVFANIEPGTYTLKETTAPVGYQLNTETHSVSVSADMSITIDGAASASFASYKVKNTRTPNSFTFTKTNADGTVGLSGAVFGLYQGTTAVYSATSNASGVVSFANIESGTYTLKETTAPVGYTLNTETHAVVVAADMSITIDGAASSSFAAYKVKNTRTPNGFTFTKTNADGTVGLSGAVFGLYNSSDVAVYSATSNATGIVSFANIEPGTYTLKETTAPVGYTLNTETHAVVVAADMSITIDGAASANFAAYKVKNTRTPNSFTFTKTNAAGTVGLSGAVFGLYQGTTSVYSATSNASGAVSFANIEPGTYTLKETTAPVGYVASSETHTVVVATDMSITIDGAASADFATHKVKNTRTPNGFTFTKTNADGTVGLSGAVFGLYQGTTSVYSATSNAIGVVSFANIEPGTYTLKETTPPVGYTLNTETHAVVVAADMSITIDGAASADFASYKVKNTRTPNSFTFTKTNAAGTVGLGGAVFGLYNSSDVAVYSATSNATGAVSFANIEPGTYTLKETTTPVGYTLNTETHSVVVAADMSITIDGAASSAFAAYNFENERTPNDFQFIKTGKDDAVLSGAVFGLYNSSDVAVYSATSNATGIVSFANIEPGTYTLKETTTPVGYTLNTETHSVVVAADMSITIDGAASANFSSYKVKNTKIPNNFTFNKVDGNGNGLAGAVFGLYQGTTEVYSATSNATGVVSFANIEPGTYTLKETTAPTGYTLNTETHAVVVASDMSITIDGAASANFASYKVKNTRTPNSFTFTKTNADGTVGLSGAVFGLYQGATEVYSATSNATGIVSFANIEPGTYTLKETTAPVGYTLNTETHAVVVAADMSITIDGAASANFAAYKVKNTRTPNSFTFTKTNADGTVGLSGAVFGLYQGATEVYSATSDATGAISFANIEPGTYTLKETTAPVGYTLNTETHAVVVASDMSITIDGAASASFASYKVKNTRTPNSFTFTKTNAAGTTGLSGAVFGLYQGTTEVYSATSNATGVVNFANIEPGTYTLKETTAPTGYELNTETHAVVVASDMSITIDGAASSSFATHKVKNTRTPNSFTFTKTNAAGTVGLSGAVFGLYQGATEVYSAISAADGTISFANIEPGTYTLKETTAPTGYTLNTETHAVVVAADMSITIDGAASADFASYKVKNTRTPNSFTFTKTNTAGTVGLSGAVFGLYQGTTAVYSATSNATGVVSFANIEPGTYILKETTPPVGYTLNTETHAVVVAADMSITIDGAASANFALHKVKNTRTPNSFTFTKTNADGTVGLSGAVFGLYQGTTAVYSATSNASGIVSFANIEPGTYTLKETTAPVGYTLNTETHAVVVASDMSITIDGAAASSFAAYKVKNTRTPNGFTFTKTNAAGTVGLSGAVFGLYQGTTAVYSATSNATGVVSFANIEPGTYTLKETTPPVGYTLNTETHAVVVASDMSIQIDGAASASFAAYKVKNTRTPNSFTFTKTNAAGTVGLSGAVFGLYQGTTAVYSATSNATGVVSFANIEPGTYTLKETTAPVGYTLNTETHAVVVAADMSITIDGAASADFASYKVKNTRTPNSFTFTKTNTAGTVGLSGAVFGLYNSSDVEVYSATSNATGVVSFANIEPGTYILKETTPPVGYTLNTETHAVVVASDMSIQIDGAASASFAAYKVKNTRTPNSFTFTKTNAAGTVGLSGAVFGLYQGTTAVYSATSNATGVVSFANIEPGTYTLKETTAPVGYTLNTETHAVVVAADMSIQIDGAASASFAAYKVKNTRTPNSFTFTKTNAAGTEGLSGAVFGLYQGTTAVYSAISATDGTVVFANIEPGKYTLKETTAPVGYTLNTETHAVVVAADMSITIDGAASANFAAYKVKNTRTPNSFTFTKTNADGTVGLAGAVFGLYQGTTAVYSATSNATGVVSFANIEPGTYTLKETTAPVGYTLNTETHSVVVASDMSITIDGAASASFAAYKVKNTRTPNSFTFAKTNAAGTVGLSGAVFGLYQGTTAVYSATSNATGVVSFANIEPGKYTLKETTAPVGYTLNTETHAVVVAADMSITIDGAASASFASYKVKNTRTPNGFTFTKTNTAGTVGLSGAVFGLYQGTTAVYSATSNATGAVSFANIEPGTYTLKETTAPVGYTLNTETHSVVVATDMSIQIDGAASASFAAYKVKNTRTPNSFTFTKTNAAGTEGLSGAVFGLYQGTTAVYSATSNATGVVSFANIEPGTYTLKETTAPVGYTLNTETHAVVVASDMSITIDGAASANFASYKVKNTRTPNSFTFTKTNADGTVGLSGAVFGLYQGATEVYSATSNATGTVSFANIEPGTYTLKETTAPVGYTLNTETHSVSVSADMSITIDGNASADFASYKVKNTRTPNSFTFTKTNAAGTTGLSGAVFGLYQGTTAVYSATSNATGVVAFSNIEPGTYTLKETTAPVGYELSTETHEVVIAIDMSITIDGTVASELAGYKFTNKRISNAFSFIKTNQSEKGISGAVFGLYNGSTLVYSATSAADGKVSFANIEPGTYTLKETTAPVGYVASTETHAVVVAADMSITIDGSSASNFAEYTFENERTPNDFQFIKTGKDGVILEGAVFGLYQGTTSVYSATSNATGVVSFANIEPGTYTLKETTAPVGYELSTETHEVVIAIDMSITIDGTVASELAGYKFTNKRISNAFSFIKTNQSEKGISGAVFGLYNGSILVYSATSTTDGKVVFTNIEPGTYTLKEITAPAGYVLSAETHIVVVSADMSIKVDGAASSYFATYKLKNTENEIPKTGEDNSNYIFLGLGLMMLGFVLLKDQKKKRNI